VEAALMTRETNEQMIKRLMVWDHPPYDNLTFPRFEDFHEWCVELAIKKFRGKRNQEAPPVCCYVLPRPGGVSVLNTPWESPDEKARVMYMMRRMVSHPIMKSVIPWLATINEVWVASQAITEGRNIDEVMQEYGEVRLVPGREDGLMVVSQRHDGTGKATRWIVKPKPDPQKSIMLARDDFEIGGPEHYIGRHVNYFSPEIPE